MFELGSVNPLFPFLNCSVTHEANRKLVFTTDKFLFTYDDWNCTGIGKLSKCYRDVSKILIVGSLRPENEREFGGKLELIYRKIILP